ncbi:MAG TPA: 4'-phosphopantetheinyl transferase superfamily protein [Solirubrobacteraceae bacterium]|jgi:4'-phosphopantetheinyl transferase|nr:4'-phosphopantetheinyl transferase superfamily protein [Solirubrobacteraceae bacterium]
MGPAVTGGATCVVHLADPGGLSPRHDRVLSEQEAERAARFVREADRARYVAATALLRAAAGALTGMPPAAVALDRSCPRCGKPHGRPRLPGTGLHASIAHSGACVAVALTRAGPVGVDVEEIGAAPDEALLVAACAPQERPHARDAVGFFRCWTRKEAVLKATGDGLEVPMTAVAVTPPAAPPALVAYGARPLEARLLDFEPRAGYAGAVAVLTRDPVELAVREGTALLVAAPAGRAA